MTVEQMQVNHAQSSATPLPERPSAPVAQMAAEMVMEYGEHSDQAANALHAALRAEYPEFYEWKAERAMRQWCFEQIRMGRTALRRQIANGPKGRETAAIQSLDAASLAAVVGWYDWPLLNGMKLGDATVMELEEAATKYETDAGVYRRRAAFLRGVQSMLPNADARVRDVLAADDLRQIAIDAEITAEVANGRS
jgi:hypothetical protein